VKQTHFLKAAAPSEPPACPQDLSPRFIGASGPIGKCLLSSDFRASAAAITVESLPLREVLRRTGARVEFAGICEYRGEFESGRDGKAEVLCGAPSDNKNPRFTGIFLSLKPSDGLEPSTPSLP
jgi:hypothetical protein